MPRGRRFRIGGGHGARVVAPGSSQEHRPAGLAQDAGDVGEEPGGLRSVDEPVVEREVRVSTSRSAISPWCSHGVRRTAPTARIPASPGLRIGVPASTPKTPTFVIENVPPVMSAGAVRPARAVPASSAIASARSTSGRASASRTTGTTSPRSVAAAIPRLTKWCSTISPASSSQRALSAGVRPRARHTAFATIARTPMRCPSRARSVLSEARSSVVAVTSSVRTSWRAAR